MVPSLVSTLKRCALDAVSCVARKHGVLLPQQARDEKLLLQCRTAYRVEDAIVRVHFSEPATGLLHAELTSYNGFEPSIPLWEGSAAYDGPGEWTFNTDNGAIRFGGREVGAVAAPLPHRRFNWRFDLNSSSGRSKSRTTGHYLPQRMELIEENYFSGDNYVDYEAQFAAEPEIVLEMLHGRKREGRILEIGCATGSMMLRLEQAGFDTYGMEVSPWAAEQAAARLGPSKIWQVDVEKDAIPAAVEDRGPFDVIVLWAVLEHFREPYAVLEKLSGLAKKGTLLLINTSNVASLTRQVFGKDWEGYYDPTHYGVEVVHPAGLRERLPKLGWQVDSISTHIVWDGSSDPTHATLREWYANDGRFRRLLGERNLGDMIRCAATFQ